MSLHDILLGDIMPASGTFISIGKNQYDSLAPPVPVYSIHDRILDMYDGSNSGVIIYNHSGKRLELITSTIPSAPIITDIRIEVGDLTGGTIIPGSTSTPYEFYTEIFNTHPSIFSWTSNNKLTINADGVYEFYYKITVDQTDDNETAIQIWLEKNSTLVSGSISATSLPFIAGAAVFPNSATGSIIESCSSGDVIQLILLEAVGVPVEQQPDGGLLIVRKVS